MKRVIKFLKVFPIVIVLVIGYFVYEAIYPGDDFYKEEFHKVTERNTPKSAKIIDKSASYPDLHGDYCSSSQVRLSRQDFQRLLREVEGDITMESTTEIIYFEEFESILNGKQPERILKKFIRKGGENTERYLFIGFYDDFQTIFINVCKT